MGIKRVEGLLVERAAGEVLVIKTSTDEAHALNQSAGIVFDLCDGTTTKAEMAAEIERRTGLPADTGIVDLAVAELVDAGLVSVETSEETPALTRRSVIRRLALAATAAAALPIVETILVPSASSQAPGSPEPEGRHLSTVKPVSIKPMSHKPVSVKPVSVKPVSVKPVSVKPVSVKPVSIKPMSVRPRIDFKQVSTRRAPDQPQ